MNVVEINAVSMFTPAMRLQEEDLETWDPACETVSARTGGFENCETWVLMFLKTIGAEPSRHSPLSPAEAGRCVEKGESDEINQ